LCLIWRRVRPKIPAFILDRFMPKATHSPPIDSQPSYEDALQELEQLVGRLESGQLPLDQLLSGYQRGAELLAYCRSRLDAVEQQIQVLDNGTLKPWANP